MSNNNGKSILLVEDEPIIAGYEKGILQKYGYAVIAVCTGEEAIEAVETMPGVDLVLMDINLDGGMSGAEAATRILATHDVPLIFVSSHTEPEAVEKTEGIPSYGYIVRDSGETVFITSIKMAFRLFEAKINEKKKAEALRPEIINDRKLAEENLKFSEEKFLKAFMKNPVAMGITRMKDLRIIDINETFVKKSGFTREEIIGHTSPELLLWENLEEREAAKEILLRDGEIVGKECRYRMKDGTILIGEYSGYIITIGGEKHILIWILDITDRKRAEEKVQTLLREKELLLREVHHRIKNNMNTIKSLLSLQSFAVKNQEAASALRDAMARVQSMGMLYDKLNKFSSIDDIPADIYLVPLADEIVSLFPGGGAVKVEKNIGDFLLSVNVLTPLGIIVNELITNAMKYAFPGGEGGTIWISALKQGRAVTLAVENNGIELPDNFDIGKHGGFGLELVGMLVGQIGGTIRAERGRGARFVLEFDAGEGPDR